MANSLPIFSDSNWSVTAATSHSAWTSIPLGYPRVFIGRDNELLLFLSCACNTVSANCWKQTHIHRALSGSKQYVGEKTQHHRGHIHTLLGQCLDRIECMFSLYTTHRFVRNKHFSILRPDKKVWNKGKTPLPGRTNYQTITTHILLTVLIRCIQYTSYFVNAHRLTPCG